MFAVYSCCQPFRRFQLFPPDLSKFREKWTAWTARQTGFHTVLVQSRSRTSVPALWLNCSGPNSDRYRLCPRFGSALRCALRAYIVFRLWLREAFEISLDSGMHSRVDTSHGAKQEF